LIETQRLRLRHFVEEDAATILKILNEPSFIENVGDKGVRTIDDAIAYLQNGPIASYAANGFGAYLVELKESGKPIGMCGLLKRAQFDDPDIGYTFFPEFWRQGFAAEAVAAVLDESRRTLGIDRIIAIVSPHNTPSSKLLEKLGFAFRETTNFQPSGDEVLLYESRSPSHAQRA
jgi:RimJ/RimL family protein N-acetyltransferase